MPRIFLLLTDPTVAARLRLVIESTAGMRVVGREDTIQRARAALPGARADLVLADLQLPDGRLGPFAAELGADARYGRPRLVALTLSLEEAPLLEAMCQGADGYFVQGGSNEALLQVIEAACAGAAEMAPSIARQLKAHLDALVPHERQLLHQIADGFLPHEIARELQISPREVGQRVRELYRRLRRSPGGPAMSLQR
jgi:DNA-binding NarL/FixJ family response regulator